MRTALALLSLALSGGAAHADAWNLQQSDEIVGGLAPALPGRPQLLVHARTGEPRVAFLSIDGLDNVKARVLRARFDGPLPFALGLDDVVAAVGDVNGDGREEFLLQSRASGAVALVQEARVLWSGQGQLAGGWNLGPADVFLGVGDLTGDGRPDILVRSGAGGDRYLGVLSFDPATGGLAAVTGLHNEIPGGWSLAPSDAFLAVGDVNGDGSSEVLVQGRAPADRAVGLLSFDAQARTLRMVAVARFAVEGWNLAPSDAWTAAGDLTGDGRNELLVQSRRPGERWLGVLTYDVERGALRTVARMRDVIPGGWTLSPSDSWLAVGDLDGDRRWELLVQSRSGDRAVGLLGFNPAAHSLVLLWSARDQIAGGWNIDPSDAFRAVGDLDGDRRPDVLVQSRTQGALGVLGFDPSTRGLVATSIARDRIGGGPWGAFNRRRPVAPPPDSVVVAPPPPPDRVYMQPDPTFAPPPDRMVVAPPPPERVVVVPPPPPPMVSECGAGPDPGCSAARNGRWPADRDTFRGLVESLRATPNELSRQEMVMSFLDGNAVTARQFGMLLDLFPNELLRLDIARQRAGSVVDPSRAIGYGPHIANSILRQEFVQIMASQR